MPVYIYKCAECQAEVERLQQMDAEPPSCCGVVMSRKLTYPAMVKVKGSGGYPSRRKMIKGSAPYSGK